VLREGGFDAVLLMGWYLKAFHQALWSARLAGIPVLARGDSQLATPRSPWKRAAKRLAYPLFLRQFSAALVVGQRNRAYWRHYGYPASRVFDSPHCVDTDWFASRATQEARAEVRARLGIASTAPVALFAGKLLPNKHPLDVVGGAARCRAMGVPMEVLVAGAGPLQHELQGHAAALNVPLHLLGFCNQSKMPAAYAAADMLVLSSSSETWGLVANEALACGRPVVLSDAVGCATDLVGDGAAGTIFPMGDTEALGHAMAGVAKYPPALQAIRSRSESFGLEAAAQGVVAAVAHVMRKTTAGVAL
jgi:glycosyltransferase involved in cell wall biosynthesis